MKLGSLFDGSGGFPLAATLCGIIPVWASEIEPYQIRVTKKNFPHMKHLGDITKINGAEIEPVDIITFGSPCQDLSVAGKRAGLDGERSGLFLEAIRIIKEMRRATSGRYPTFIIWENVPGAFSSNGGEDYRTVLEEIAKITENKPIISKPPNGWTGSGAIMGRKCSIAWRVLDAQYWGVPQRRKRIFLVADFGGQRASQILFEREGLQWDITQGEKEREETTVSFRNCIDTAEQESHVICIAGNTIDRKVQNGGNGTGAQEDISYTLNTIDRHAVCAVDCRNYCTSKISGTLQAKENGGHSLNYQNPVMIEMTSTKNTIVENRISPTLTARMGTGGNQVNAVCMAQTAYAKYHQTNKTSTLKAKEGSCGGGSECLNIQNGVRRLTPLECCRLQGFPDWWCDGVVGSDSAQYKMWGNGIALPCALYVMQGIAEVER